MGVLRRRAPADAGWSLIETVVAMTLMSIAATIFTAGFVQIYHTFAATQEQTAAQQQLTTAFLRLDKEVQYAAGLSLPTKIGNDWYVEYLIAAGPAPRCVELRLNAAARQLQRRSWTNLATITPTPWMPLASDVTAATTGVAPFTLLPADPAITYHRLRVSVASTAGRQTETIWPALNAGTDPTDSICTGARGMP